MIRNLCYTLFIFIIAINCWAGDKITNNLSNELTNPKTIHHPKSAPLANSFKAKGTETRHSSKISQTKSFRKGPTSTYVLKVRRNRVKNSSKKGSVDSLKAPSSKLNHSGISHPKISRNSGSPHRVIGSKVSHSSKISQPNRTPIRSSPTQLPKVRGNRMPRLPSSNFSNLKLKF